MTAAPPATAGDLLGLAGRDLAQALNDDPEFRIAARYWTGRVRLSADAVYLTIVVTDGVVTAVEDAMTGFDPYDIVLAGPLAVWRRILAPVPVPFYQDFWSARFGHGFRLEGDLDLLCAYYGAVRRLGDILRRLVNDPPAAAPA